MITARKKNYIDIFAERDDSGDGEEKKPSMAKG